MRVVHVANAYTPRSGGIRTTVHAFGHGYRAAGHEFVLVVPGPRTTDEELPWGRRITLAAPKFPRSGGYRLLADLRRVRAVLDALGPDRLEVSDRHVAWAGSLGQRHWRALDGDRAREGGRAPARLLTVGCPRCPAGG